MGYNGDTKNAEVKDFEKTMYLEQDLIKWQREAGAPLMRRCGVREGDTVIDFGCGIGNYAFAAALAVGETGTVYALDVKTEILHDLRREAAERGIAQLIPAPSHEDAQMDYPDGSADVILIYDLIHALKDRARFLSESRRVLKDGGILSILPFHMTGEEILEMLDEVGAAGFALQETLPEAGVHFDLHKVYSDRPEALTGMELGDIYTFVKAYNRS